MPSITGIFRKVTEPYETLRFCGSVISDGWNVPWREGRPLPSEIWFLGAPPILGATVNGDVMIESWIPRPGDLLPPAAYQYVLRRCGVIDAQVLTLPNSEEFRTWAEDEYPRLVEEGLIDEDPRH